MKVFLKHAIIFKKAATTSSQCPADMACSTTVFSGAQKDRYNFGRRVGNCVDTFRNGWSLGKHTTCLGRMGQPGPDYNPGFNLLDELNKLLSFQDLRCSTRRV